MKLKVILSAVAIFLVTLTCQVKAEMIGQASWYSYQSCRLEGTSGIWTASGERFNEYAFTAAMLGVRFGTLVKVTNLRNGKSVIVKVNDRFAKRLKKKGRIIDLSKKTFHHLSNGNLKKGILRVKVEVLSKRKKV
jgi:rare lipoprotein A